MKLACRTAWELTPNRFSKVLRAKHHRNDNILDLTESNPTRAQFDFLRPDLLECLRDPANLIYDPDPHGLLVAREAVCRYYARHGLVVAPDQILLTAGTSEAYGFVFKLLADPGRTVLAPAPGYPLFEYLAALHDVDVRRYCLAEQPAWHIASTGWEDHRPSEPCAVLVVHPNNPTGNYLSTDERECLNTFCASTGAAIIADEVFYDYWWGGGLVPYASFACNSKVLTFTLSGISKVLGLPQMKISWIVVSGPEKEREETLRRLEVIADTFLSPAIPSQRALEFWFAHQETVQREITGRLRGNLKRLQTLWKGPAKEGDTRLLTAEGGWYAMIRLAEGQSDEDCALTLLEKENVLVHPGFFFDCPHGNYLVLSLLTPSPIFEEGALRIYRYLHR